MSRKNEKLLKKMILDYGAQIDASNPIARLIAISEGRGVQIGDGDKARTVYPTIGLLQDALKFLASRRIPALKSVEHKIDAGSADEWAAQFDKFRKQDGQKESARSMTEAASLLKSFWRVAL